MPDAIEPPRSLEEAEARRTELTNEIQRIQSELGMKSRTDSQGQRLPHTEYWAWRDDAQRTLTAKLSELRLLKSWVRSNQKPGEARSDTVKHLVELYELAEQLRVDDVDFEPDEIEKVEGAGRHLRSIGAIT